MVTDPYASSHEPICLSTITQSLISLLFGIIGVVGGGVVGI